MGKHVIARDDLVDDTDLASFRAGAEVNVPKTRATNSVGGRASSSKNNGQCSAADMPQ